MPRQRVICVGNELCHDDGVAHVVGRLVEQRCNAFGDTEVTYVGEFGLSILDAFLDVDHVVVVDAVVTGNRPGSCQLVTNPEFSPDATCSVGHAITLASMLELVAQVQTARQVPRITVVGIEAESLTPFGTSLSPSVSAAVPDAVALVITALGGCMATPH